jgi:hypothetical protein
MLTKNLNDKYNPLYFLAALGAGGLAVSFFMYPNFMLAHAGPVLTFNEAYAYLMGSDKLTAIMLSGAMIAIAALAILHFRLLFWNISEYRKFKKTDEFKALKSSNREITLMAIPLTYAMSINVMFILGALFVPDLWSVVEYLFPVSIAAFLAVGIFALNILGNYFTRIFTQGDFNFEQNNNFAQMIAVFALVMVSVGFAASGAMSHYKEINAIGMFLSIFFLSISIILLVIKMTLGFKSSLKRGVDKGTSVSLWMMIPILTLIGITVIRLTMGLHHGFEEALSKPSFFIVTSTIISLQMFIGIIGYKVMKSVGYFKDFSQGDSANAGSFGLVCPGVAFFVFGMFFLVFGLVKNDLITLMSPAFFVLLAPLVLIQLQTLRVFFRLLCNVTACGPCKLKAA